MASSTPLLWRRRVIAAREEATPGVAIALGAAYGRFNVFNPEVQPDIGFEDREGQGGFSPLAGVPSARGATVTFRVELAGTGQPSDPVPPWADVFLPACGWVEAAGVFSPSSLPPGAAGAATHTITIGLYLDGKLKRLRGCMGTFRLVMTAGVPIAVEFTFTGVWDTPEAAALVAPNYPDTQPLRFAQAEITLGGPGSGSGVWHPTLQEITIEAGNEVQLREDPEDESAWQCAMITGRRVTASLNPEATLIAAKDLHTEWVERTIQELSIEVPAGGSADGNHIEIVAPAFQITNVQGGERNGYAIETVEGLCARASDAGDDELSLAFS